MYTNTFLHKTHFQAFVNYSFMSNKTLSYHIIMKISVDQLTFCFFCAIIIVNHYYF